jgi:hypothetical protein
VDPSKNVTEPVGVLPEDETVAVKITVLCSSATAAEEDSVTVGATFPAVTATVTVFVLARKEPLTLA